jgi:hypothetical protein
VKRTFRIATLKAPVGRIANLQELLWEDLSASQSAIPPRAENALPVEDLVARLLALGLLRESNEAVDAVGTRLTASGLTRDLDPHAGTWALS